MARKAKIPEEEAVQIVIDHLSEIGDRNARCCLSSATTLAKLRELLKIHRHRLFPAAQPQRRMGNTLRPNNLPTNSQVPYQQQQRPNQQQMLNTVRCYNCSRTDGHTQSQSTYPIRDPNACFRCWLPGHNRFNCPNPPYRPLPVRQPQRPYQQQYQQQPQQPQYQRQPQTPQQRQPPQRQPYPGPGNNRLVAAVAAQEPQFGVLPDHQPLPFFDSFADRVSVKFEGDRGTHSKSCLLDTGSPASLIRLSAVPQRAVKVAAPDSTLRAIGGAPLKFKGAVNSLISLRRQPAPCRLLVVPHSYMGTETLLGRDFMGSSGIVLRHKKYTKNELCSIENKQPKKCTPDLSRINNLGFCAPFRAPSSTLAAASFSATSPAAGSKYPPAHVDVSFLIPSPQENVIAFQPTTPTIRVGDSLSTAQAEEVQQLVTDS